MGKAETASRNKNFSGAADRGESRDGGTRAVSFSDPVRKISAEPAAVEFETKSGERVSIQALRTYER